MSAKRRHQIILVMKRERVLSPGGTSPLYSFPQGPKPAEREVYSQSLLLLKQVPNSYPCLGQGTISGGQVVLCLLPVDLVTSDKVH